MLTHVQTQGVHIFITVWYNIYNVQGFTYSMELLRDVYCRTALILLKTWCLHLS